MPDSLEPFQYTVWTEFTPMAIRLQAINLGQGFPGFKCPDFVKSALNQACAEDNNQYCRPAGHPPLAEEIARVYGKKHNRVINPLTEVSVSHGASEALMLAAMAIISPGDEVIVIDPCFDIYIPQLSMRGAKIIRVSLIPPADETSPWTIDYDRLEASFNERTRAFMFNTPNNPIGKVFTIEELQKLAEILNKWPDVAIIADEVYEYIVFDGRKHVSICDIGDLWERTVTLSSAGKIFSVTGWKTGWAIGGEMLIKKMVVAKLWITYCSNTPCQDAIARCLRFAENEYEGFPSYYEWLNHQYILKREILIDILKNTKAFKVRPLLCEGGFFLTARIEDPQEFIPPSYLENGSVDFAFCRWMAETLKVVAIPSSAFFSEEYKHFSENLVRFALCKDFSDYEKVKKILNPEN